MPYIDKAKQKASRQRSYEKKKAMYDERVNRWKAERAKWLEEYKKTLSCIRCGENHPACLEFHHRDPKAKEGSISKLVRGRNEAGIMRELAKCDVLCANCHKKLHWKWNMASKCTRSILDYESSGEGATPSGATDDATQESRSTQTRQEDDLQVERRD